MNNSNFDIYKYISETFKERDDTPDVFEELDKYFYQIPSAPPSTPEHTPRIAIDIPNDTFTIAESSDDDNINTIDNIQSILSYSKYELLITSYLEKKEYRRPTHKSRDARNIWKSAKIPKYATIYNIELLLLDWAFTYASLEIYDKKIISIKWNTINNSKCQSTWKCFLHWIICASNSQ